MYGLCPDLSPPKPLDQSKNVTVRTYHNLWEEKNGRKNWPKSAKKSQNLFFGLGRSCLRAGLKGQPQARRRCGPEGHTDGIQYGRPFKGFTMFFDFYTYIIRIPVSLDKIWWSNCQSTSFETNPLRFLIPLKGFIFLFHFFHYSSNSFRGELGRNQPSK